MYAYPQTMKVYCHRCQELRWHEDLRCNSCSNRKSLVELVCTFSDSDGWITLPQHAMASQEVEFAERYRYYEEEETDVLQASDSAVLESISDE